LKAYSLEENYQRVDLSAGWSTSEVVEGSCQHIDFECPQCSAVIYQNNGDSTDPKITELLT
jgi:predicted RNA-binding Zn-ribbon protein involved in translation (DUF1610 family)